MVQDFPSEKILKKKTQTAPAVILKSYFERMRFHTGILYYYHESGLELETSRAMNVRAESCTFVRETSLKLIEVSAHVYRLCCDYRPPQHPHTNHQPRVYPP